MDSEDFPAERSFPLAPEAAPGTPEALWPYVDNGTEVFAPDRYFSPEFARDEWENMWARVWTLAGLVTDLAEVGDYFKYHLGPESFIVVRTGTGEEDIKAYYNVCHHRGNRLVLQDFGSVQSFKCLFHSWEWALDGTLLSITDRETFRPEVIADDLPLSEVRCEIWAGFVFLNMDPDAGPLLDFLDVLPEHLAPYRIQDMKIVKDLQTEWPCNWKTGHDAFIEVYHVHAVHPEILPFFDDYVVQWDLFGNGMTRQLLKFGEVSRKLDDHETLNDGLKMMLEEVDIDPETFEGKPNDVRAVVQKAKRAKAEKLGLDYSPYSDNQMTDDWNYGVFPNITFNAHPEGLLIQRFRPHPRDPEKMTYDIQVLVHPNPDPEYTVPAYMGVEEGTDISGKTRPERRHIEYGQDGLGYVIAQDAFNMKYVQLGLKSRGYAGARYSEQEQQVRHWHKELERYMNGEK